MKNYNFTKTKNEHISLTRARTHETPSLSFSLALLYVLLYIHTHSLSLSLALPNLHHEILRFIPALQLRQSLGFSRFSRRFSLLNSGDACGQGVL